MVKIFISHSSRDKRFAKKLHKILKSIGHSPWLDEWDIEIGECIQKAVEKGIEDSDYLIVVLTPHAIESGWVEREWRTKYWQEAESKSIQVLTIMKTDCKIPALLKSKRYADFRKEFAIGCAQLITKLKHTEKNVYSDHSWAELDLRNEFKQNKAGKDSVAYFFQYSGVEIRSVLKQAVQANYKSVVFIQDPERVPISRQKQRIAVSLDEIRRFDNGSGNVSVYQVRPPVTPKIIYVPDLFIALSYYIYLDPNSAPRDDQDDISEEDSSSWLYDVSGHDNPVILIRVGETGWDDWSCFAEELNERYLECSRLIYPI